MEDSHFNPHQSPLCWKCSRWIRLPMLGLRGAKTLS